MKKHLYILAAILTAAFTANATPISYSGAFQSGLISYGLDFVYDNGTVVSGTLNNGAQTLNLYTWSGGGSSSIRLTDGTDLIVDNTASILGSNLVLDGNGLAFVSAALDINGHPLEGINVSGDGSTSFANYAGFGTDGYLNPNLNGTITVTQATSVPDATATGGLLTGSLGLLAFVAKRKALFALLA